MRKYVKPSVNVIELQLKENIAAVPTTVYKGSSRSTASYFSKQDIAFSTEGSGTTGDYNASVVA